MAPQILGLLTQSDSSIEEIAAAIGCSNQVTQEIMMQMMMNRMVSQYQFQGKFYYRVR